MVISVDWLQLHCSGYIRSLSGLDIRRLPYQTRQFSCIDEVYISDKRFCTLTHTPLSSILDERMVLLKIDNAYLYDKSYHTHLTEIINKLQLTIIGISRLDICADFNHFHNNINPHNFIKNFFKCRYRKIGFSKFKAMGEQKKSIEFDYLRFGTNNSVCCSYLYNKSKEMSEVKEKSYIRDTWQSSGLDMSKDIWRLEFSIKGNQIKINKLDTGELLDITVDMLRDYSNLKLIYYSLQDSYFKFRFDTGKKNVTREKTIQLLPTTPMLASRYIFKEAGDGTKADKMFIKKLEGLNNELRSLGADYQANVSDILTHFVYHKGLTDFYERKINGHITYALKRLAHQDANTIFKLKNHIGTTTHVYQLELPFGSYSKKELLYITQSYIN